MRDLKDHEIREFVNELTAVAVEYAGTQQLRSRIQGVVFPLLVDGRGRSEVPKQESPQPSLQRYMEVVGNLTGALPPIAYVDEWLKGREEGLLKWVADRRRPHARCTPKMVLDAVRALASTYPDHPDPVIEKVAVAEEAKMLMVQMQITDSHGVIKVWTRTFASKVTSLTNALGRLAELEEAYHRYWPWPAGPKPRMSFMRADYMPAVSEELLTRMKVVMIPEVGDWSTRTEKELEALLMPVSNQE